MYFGNQRLAWFCVGQRRDSYENVAKAQHVLPMVGTMHGHPLLIPFSTLSPRQNDRHFPDDTFNHIFVNENVGISIKLSLKFVPRGPINNIPALVQIMAWRRPGDKPLSEPTIACSSKHICVTRPQWVNMEYKMIETIAKTGVHQS